MIRRERQEKNCECGCEDEDGAGTLTFHFPRLDFCILSSSSSSSSTSSSLGWVLRAAAGWAEISEAQTGLFTPADQLPVAGSRTDERGSVGHS